MKKAMFLLLVLASCRTSGGGGNDGGDEIDRALLLIEAREDCSEMCTKLDECTVTLETVEECTASCSESAEGIVNDGEDSEVECLSVMVQSSLCIWALTCEEYLDREDAMDDRSPDPYCYAEGLDVCRACGYPPFIFRTCDVER